MNCIEQFILVEWFGKVSQCAVREGSRPSPFIRPVRSYENDRHFATAVEQMTVKLNSTHPRHPDIQYQARNFALNAGCKEVFRHTKAADRMAIRFKKVTDCILDRLIVVDDCNHVRTLLDYHN